MTSTQPRHRAPDHPSWHGLRQKLRDRRQARTAQRSLEAELAAYTTPAEVNDLLATFSDVDGPEADQVRTILANNLAYRIARPSAA